MVITARMSMHRHNTARQAFRTVRSADARKVVGCCCIRVSSARAAVRYEYQLELPNSNNGGVRRSGQATHSFQFIAADLTALPGPLPRAPVSQTRNHTEFYWKFEQGKIIPICLLVMPSARKPKRDEIISELLLKSAFLGLRLLETHANSPCHLPDFPHLLQQRLIATPQKGVTAREFTYPGAKRRPPRLS